MWMMGYNDGGDFNAIQDPFTGRKLRPLMPRPATTAAALNHPCLTRFHGADLLTLNHHLVRMGEENKREISTQQVVVSSRWNPTPEQLQSLEELYRRGTRTPSAEQIQHITAELRRYGKIEGKNVFYWFQNHKARERQKRRRQQSLSDEKRETTGPNKTVYEVEQTKNWPSPTNSSTLAADQKSGEAEAECKAGDGWVQFEDDAELQRRRNATWRMMNNLSCSSSPPTVTSPAIPSTVGTLQFKPQDFINIFLEPYHPTHGAAAPDGAQTLQLFPLRSGGESEEEESGAAPHTATHVTPYQFFEFLPLKK